MKTRNESTIINLRLFHNWIKSVMTIETVNYLKKNYDIKDISLLDLAVGRGGDMLKWLHSGIYDVEGIDIDEESIMGNGGATQRYLKLIKDRKLLNTKGTIRDKVPDYKFYIYDLSLPSSIGKVDNILDGKKFDIISCQFAIHYFFREESSLHTIMKIVSKNLKKDGFFIGTTLDGNYILDVMGNNNSFENNVFSVNLQNISGNKYGNTYEISLGERGEDHYFRDKPSIEYLVSIDELKKVGEEYGLIFLGVTKFSEWYEKNLKESGHKKIMLSNDEKAFSFLNFSFVFTKKN